MAEALAAMGFPLEQCQRALSKAQGNFDAALEVLLNGGGDDEPEPAPVPAPTARAAPAVSAGGDDEIPEHFLCAITCELMTDPVVTMDGHTYERSAIEEWLESRDTSPITNEPLESKSVIPNIHLRTQIREFVAANPHLAGNGNTTATPSSQVPAARRRSTNMAPKATMGGDLAPPRTVKFVKGRPIGLDLDDFLCVRSVHPDSQGYTNRITKFEAIIELNGQPVSTVGDLRQAMSRIPNQSEMTMTIVSPYVKSLTKGQPFGLSLTESMVVQSIASTSQAVTRGVRVNSRLVAVDNQSVTFSELAGVLGSKAHGNEIEFTFVPPVFVDGPTATAVASAVAPVQAVRAAEAQPQRPPQAPRQASFNQPAPPPPVTRPAAAPTRRMTMARRGRSYMSGEDHDVKLPHRQLGFAVQECEGDEGLLRVTDVRPTARTAGVGLGELVIAVNGVTVDIPCTVAAFTQIVADSPRPIEIKLFRCTHFEGIPHVPRPLLLSGYLAKKSRSGSTFRPWSDRFVEILPDGYLTYKAVKKTKGKNIRESVDMEEANDSVTISLINCQVLPLARKRIAKDFAFEVKAAAATGTKEQSVSLTLAASNAQEGATWIKTIQTAAVKFTEDTVKRRRDQMAEVADAITLHGVLKDSKESEDREEAEEKELEERAAAASEASEAERRTRREAEEEAEIQRVILLSEEADRDHKARNEENEVEDRKSMLQALLLSSDMYAQQLHGTADEQKGRDLHRLAYDSYKLAVSFYLKAQAIADELENDPRRVDAATMERIQSDADASMAAADECFLKSNISTKKKRHTHHGEDKADKHDKHKRRSSVKKTVSAEEEPVKSTPSKIAFGGEEGPTLSPGSAAMRKSALVASEPSDNSESWFDGATANTELPEGWVEFATDDGIPYYFNESTNETTWEFPGDSGGAMDIDALAAASPGSDEEGAEEHDEEEDNSAVSMLTSALPDFGIQSSSKRMSVNLTDFVNQVTSQQNDDGSSDDSSGSSSSDSESSYSDSDDDYQNDMSTVPKELADGPAPMLERTRENRSMSLRASEGESKGRVLMELIESERRYLAVLEKIGGVSEWLQGETGAMKPKDHAELFQGSVQLLDLSKGFLNDIDNQLAGHGSVDDEDIFLEDVQIGQVLKKYMPFFKIYTVYSDTYDDKQAKLLELMGDGSTDFAKYLRAAMEDKEVTGDFQSLLIQPIQRIPRYKMLLERMVQNITKQTPDDDDLPLLKQAFQTVSDVAIYINQSLKRKEEQLKLLELQKSFFPPIVLVSPGRRLIKKGELEKIADKNNAKQKYVFFLFNDAIAYGSKLFGGYYRFHRLLSVISFDELAMTDHNTNRFRLVTDERSLTLQAKTFEDKQHWVKAITEKMNDKHKREATFQSGASSSLSTQNLFGSKGEGFNWQTARDESPDRVDVKSKKKNKMKLGGLSTNTF